jgi:hypothetical protein
MYRPRPAARQSFRFKWGAETREGWPLLTVETEANGDLWSTNERGPSLVGSMGSSCGHKSFFILPWLPVS